MKNRRIVLFFLVLAVFSLEAQSIPSLKGPVVDQAGILSSREMNEISGFILQLEASSSAQVAVLTVPDLQGYSIEEFSLKAAETWKLGQADRDNGVLVLMAVEEKKVRIEVGYGLEGDLTDAKSGFIIRERILPQFRKGNFGQGLYEGVASIAGVITSTADITSEELEKYKKTESGSGSGIPFNFLIFILIYFFSVLRRLGRRGGYRRGGLGRALFWGSVLGSSRGRSSHSGGGFSSGGFSGGGGSFGGGGSSGGW